MAGLNATGTALARSDMQPTPTFTDIANISDGPNGPSMSKTAIDMTAHNSADKYREKLGGLRDAGDVSFDINWNPTDLTHQPLLDDFHDDDDPRDYRITYPDGSTIEFSAVCIGFEPSAPLDDKLTASVTFAVSGKPIFVSAT